jgi:hypothetical protein
MREQSFADWLRALCSLYPIPIVQTAMLSFSMGCFGLVFAFETHPLTNWILAIGGLVALAAMFVVVYAVVWAPGLLRIQQAWTEGGRMFRRPLP